MKIVCTVTNDLSHDQRMDRICSSLQGAGHEVTLVGRRRPGSQPLLARPYRQHRIACRNDAGKAFYVEYNYKLVRALRGWAFDAICAVDVDTLAAGAALATGNKKLVFDAHEWFHMTPEVVHRTLVRGFWKGLARFLVPKTDLRYTVAPQLARQLEEDYGRAFFTVRNLPNLASTAAPAKSNAVEDHSEVKAILYQGMLNPGRGLEVAIAAMDDLPACQLWIAGSGPDEEALRQQVSGLRHPGRVKFLGFIPPDELPRLTRKAWLGLNLLVSSSPSYYYSLANKSLDYIQAGLPSVQMDFPEYRAIHETHGCYLLLPELNAGKLSEVISTLVREPQRYARLREECLQAAKVLNWEVEERTLLALWDTLDVPSS